MRALNHKWLRWGLVALVTALLSANSLTNAPVASAQITPHIGIVCTTSPGANPSFTLSTRSGYIALADGNTMVAETGNKRIIEVDKDDKIVKEVPLTIDKPNSHRDTRRVRKTDAGTYLVCHEGDGIVREYDGTGKVIWSYKIELGDRPRTGGHDGHGTEVFNAIRLPNGNTMIAGGSNNRVLEVDKDGKVVWSIDNTELPGIQLFWVTGLQYLPNGNLIVGNTHAGPNNPQIFEVTRDKKVVWQMKDWIIFGNDLCAQQVLDLPAGTVR